MSANATCATCGGVLAGDESAGGCPTCLMRLALGACEAETVVEANDSLQRSLGEQAGDMIGAYALLEKLGEGGCGVVWLAEQKEPLRRQVALKVIKPGMDSKQVLARFDAERQALALMDHPNIAKVFDAGATTNGRPYFVMELVEGKRITDYCDDKRLSTQERLKLFIPVCRAIEHAHQKGIIHRDIKPSNVLIADQDGGPVAKVIDFGIAKATGEQSLAGETIHTAAGSFVGTLAYMSPEQAGSEPDVDTRTDIYSLGVLLYELLTGNPPLTRDVLKQAAFDEALRRIRQEDPPQPSRRLSESGAALTTLSETRQTVPPRLVQQVRGDLDWIVMRSLEKDRQRRYNTASHLAAELERHLDGKPVDASPPSNLYRFKKLVRRNKLAVGAAIAVVLALSLGLAMTTWQFLKERAARQRAVAAEQKSTEEAAKSQQVAQFLKEMLKGVGPSVALGRDTTLLREILDQTAERVGKDLKEQPAVEAELRHTIGNTYYELADYAKAEAMHREALRLRQVVYGETNVQVAESLSALADVSSITNSEAMHRRALAIRRQIFGSRHPEVAASLQKLANTLQLQRRVESKAAEAEQLCRQALEMRRSLFYGDHEDIAQSLNDLGVLLWRKDKGLEESEKCLREALQMRKRLFGEFHPSVAETTHNLANVLRRQGKPAEGEALLLKTFEDRKRLLGDDHPQLITTMRWLADVTWYQGKFADAESMYRQELAARRKRYGDTNNEVGNTLNFLGMVIKRQARPAEAEPFFRESLMIRKVIYGTQSTMPAYSANNLASVLIEQGNATEAETLLREESKTLEEKFPDDWLTFWNRNLLGASLLLQKRFEEAEPLLTSGYLGMIQHEAKLKGVDSAYRRDLTIAKQWAARLYDAAGWPEKAAAWRNTLTLAYHQSHEVGPQFLNIYKYANGFFGKTPRTSQWEEHGEDGVVFKFVEIKSGEEAIILNDASRNMLLRLPAQGGMSQWSTDEGKTWNDLYEIQKRAEKSGD